MLAIHARDQSLRAAHLNAVDIAEGDAKRRWNDRARFLDSARGQD